MNPIRWLIDQQHAHDGQVVDCLHRLEIGHVHPVDEIAEISRPLDLGQDLTFQPREFEGEEIVAHLNIDPGVERWKSSEEILELKPLFDGVTHQNPEIGINGRFHIRGHQIENKRSLVEAGDSIERLPALQTPPVGLDHLALGQPDPCAGSDTQSDMARDGVPLQYAKQITDGDSREIAVQGLEGFSDFDADFTGKQQQSNLEEESRRFEIIGRQKVELPPVNLVMIVDDLVGENQKRGQAETGSGQPRVEIHRRYPLEIRVNHHQGGIESSREAERLFGVDRVDDLDPAFVERQPQFATTLIIRVCNQHTQEFGHATSSTIPKYTSFRRTLITRIRLQTSGIFAVDDTDTVADRVQHTVSATGTPSAADAAAVENETLGQINPLVPGYRGLEIGCDPFGIAGRRQTYPVGEPPHVGVDGDPGGHPEGLAEHHLGGLPTDSRQLDQRLQIRWDLPPMLEGDPTRRISEVLCLGSMQPGGSNHGLEVLLGSPGQFGRTRPAREDRRCHPIHPLIGALGRKHGGDEQFPRRPIIEFAFGLGIRSRQFLDDEFGPHALSPVGRTCCRR